MDVVTAYDWEAASEEVKAIMLALYSDLFAVGYDQAAGDLPVEVEFDLENPRLQRAIAKLAKKVTNVSDTTRDKIKALVQAATDEGLSTKDLAARIREAGVTDSKSRSETIARTETGTGINIGTTYAYEDAGVSKVDVFDGDGDEACASVDGTVQTLEWARDNPLAHPNCQRGFGPHLE